MSHEGGKHGFTLIELLIVIAIVLILIAIALPNFLEAQLRAKVTKVEAELVSVAHCIEVYRTDWPRYPPDASLEPTRFNPFFMVGPMLRFSLMQLTTPVRYLFEIPPDIFGPAPGERLYDGFGFPLWWADADVADGFPYIYYSAMSARNCGLTGDRADLMENRGFKYALTSLGPDRDYDFEHSDPAFFVRGNYEIWAYSATNGTRSSGDLYRKKR
jgi:general secretion pathway protein G